LNKKTDRASFLPCHLRDKATAGKTTRTNAALKKVQVAMFAPLAFEPGDWVLSKEGRVIGH
jgi:hypothetical protein